METMSWDDILFDQTPLSDVEKVAYAPRGHRVPVRMSEQLRNDLEQPIPYHKDPGVSRLTDSLTSNRTMRLTAKHLDRAMIAARKAKLEKTAGLFLKPSDIADHTNLANELENRLNGSAPEPQFKQASSNRTKMIAGGVIGFGAGTLAHYNAKNSEVPPELAPQEVQGIRGRIRKTIHDSSRDRIQYAKDNPKKSLAMHAGAGTATGVLTGSQSVSNLKDMFRRS